MGLQICPKWDTAVFLIFQGFSRHDGSGAENVLYHTIGGKGLKPHHCFIDKHPFFYMNGIMFLVVWDHYYHPGLALYFGHVFLCYCSIEVHSCDNLPNTSKKIVH